MNRNRQRISIKIEMWLYALCPLQLLQLFLTMIKTSPKIIFLILFGPSNTQLPDNPITYPAFSFEV